jgi:phosphate-selective porin OprO/OprP
MFFTKFSILTTCMICAASLTPSAMAGDDSGFKVKFKGAPEISSNDGMFKMKLRGRLFFDYGKVSSDVLGDTGVNGTEVRTARLGIEGAVFKSVKYKFEIDFSGGGTTVKDAYIEYAMKPISFKVGQFKHMNSLEEQTSSRYMTFMERGSFTDAFKLSRRVGIAAGTKGDNWTISAGYFFEGMGSTNSSANDANLFAARATFGPKFDNIQLHLGVSYFSRSQNGAVYNLGYKQRPHNHQAGKYVKSNNFDVTGENFFGLEFAAIAGPLSAQAEWGFMSNNTENSSNEPSYNGGYVQLSYFLTGEKRSYKANKGSFGSVKVNNDITSGSGAFEIAARYDVIDLTFEDTGSKQNSYQVGLNWYLNNYARIMLNYSNAKVKNYAGSDVASIDAIGARFQVNW